MIIISPLQMNGIRNLLMHWCIFESKSYQMKAKQNGKIVQTCFEVRDRVI